MKKYFIKPNERENYLDGFRDGHLDRGLGARSELAETGWELTFPGYGAGYRAGVLGLASQPPVEISVPKQEDNQGPWPAW